MSRSVSAADSWVPASHDPNITLDGAAGERQRDVAREAHAAVGPDVAPSRAASSAHSTTAENWGRPTPVIIRVVHIAPGPTPTLTMSAPASISWRVPSTVTTLPATIVTSGSPRRTASTAARVRVWWPWAVSIDEDVGAGSRPGPSPGPPGRR